MSSLRLNLKIPVQLVYDTVKVFGKEYKVESLSDSAKADLKSYEFASERLQEFE